MSKSVQFLEGCEGVECATSSCVTRTRFNLNLEIMRKNNVTFTNGNRALVVTAPRDASANAILDGLEIASPSAVILLFGGAAGLDDSRKAHLETLFADGVTPVAAELGALIIDGGTQSGVVAMMGEAVAQRREVCQLLGIAPVGKSLT